eukprot:Amastigsp_a7125_15.p2 type:complete len:152 gc:universal Amastigsp_a7125_15:367-822(+)
MVLPKREHQPLRVEPQERDGNSKRTQNRSCTLEMKSHKLRRPSAKGLRAERVERRRHAKARRKPRHIHKHHAHGATSQNNRISHVTEKEKRDEGNKHLQKITERHGRRHAQDRSNDGSEVERYGLLRPERDRELFGRRVGIKAERGVQPLK